MAGKVERWAESMRTLAGASCKHPHSTYSRLQKSLQQEWSFLKQVAPVIGDTFGRVEKALRETFLPDLFEGLGEVAPGRGVTLLPAKQAVLALPDPILTAPETHHMTPRRSSQGLCVVPDGGPLGLPSRGTDDGSEAERLAGRGGLGGNHSHDLSTRRALTATGNKYWVIAYGAAVHSERDRSGCAGMA